MAAGGDNGFIEIIRASGAHLLPNTAGCRTAREAVEQCVRLLPCEPAADFIVVRQARLATQGAARLGDRRPIHAATCFDAVLDT